MSRFLNDVGLAYLWSKSKSYVDTKVNQAIDLVGSYTVNGYEIHTNPVLTKSDVGLSNLTNDAQVKRSEMGVANGVATLDGNGLVPSSQLPSYVDDVLEFPNKSGFPGTGETGKIYVALDTNLTYRWSGSTYIEISKSLALGETSSTAYPGDKGKANRDALNSLPATIVSSVSRGTIDADSITINVNRATKSGINYGSPGAANFNFEAANTAQAGLMSAGMYNKLNGIAEGAQVNDHKVLQNAVNTTNGSYNLLGGFTVNNTASETNSVNKMRGLTYNPSTQKVTSGGGYIISGGTGEQLLAADGTVATPLTSTDIDLICV